MDEPKVIGVLQIKGHADELNTADEVMEAIHQLNVIGVQLAYSLKLDGLVFDLKWEEDGPKPSILFLCTPDTPESLLGALKKTTLSEIAAGGKHLH